MRWSKCTFLLQVNHLPGSGFITLKVELATSKLKWIPKAFSIPKEQQALATEVSQFGLPFTLCPLEVFLSMANTICALNALF